MKKTDTPKKSQKNKKGTDRHIGKLYSYWRKIWSKYK